MEKKMNYEINKSKNLIGEIIVNIDFSSPMLYIDYRKQDIQGITSINMQIDLFSNFYEGYYYIKQKNIEKKWSIMYSDNLMKYGNTSIYSHHLIFPQEIIYFIIDYLEYNNVYKVVDIMKTRIYELNFNVNKNNIIINSPLLIELEYDKHILETINILDLDLLIKKI